MEQNKNTLFKCIHEAKVMGFLETAGNKTIKVEANKTCGLGE